VFERGIGGAQLPQTLRDDKPSRHMQTPMSRALKARTHINAEWVAEGRRQQFVSNIQALMSNRATGVGSRVVVFGIMFVRPMYVAAFPKFL